MEIILIILNIENHMLTLLSFFYSTKHYKQTLIEKKIANFLNNLGLFETKLSIKQKFNNLKD
jgi:hypothetical protein